MPTCGCCKAQGQTIEHIKSCYAERRSAPVTPGAFAQAFMESRDYQPMAIGKGKWEDVLDSMYALSVNGNIEFYEVRTGNKGKWKGFRFLDRLVGAPGDWARYPVRNEAKKVIMAQIGEDAKAAAAAFGKHFTVCGVCKSPLSDKESIAAGIGPVCKGKF